MSKPDMSLQTINQSSVPLPTQWEGINLQYIESELQRIDIRIRRLVLRWQLAGQDPMDAFRGLHLSDDDAAILVHQPLGANWGVVIEAEGEETDALAEKQASLRSERLAVEAKAAGQEPRLARLVRVLGLDDFELNCLLICLAPSLDLRYERLYGYLQDDVTRKRPGVNLVLNLLCPATLSRLSSLHYFSNAAPLFKHHLLERGNESPNTRPPLLGQTLYLDEAIVTWLLGGYSAPADMAEHVTLERPENSAAEHLLVSSSLADLQRAAREESIIVFHGADEASQKAAARQVAASLDRALLTLELARAGGSDVSPARALELSMRDARLMDAVLYVTGWDNFLVDGAPPPALLGQLTSYPNLVIVGGQSAWQPRGVARERGIRTFEFPLPGYLQRKALWSHFLDELAQDDSLDIPSVAGQFLLNTGQIRDAVASARDRAGQRGERVTSSDLLASARAHSSPRLSELARKIVPRYTWDDIILPPDQLTILHEIISTVRGRPIVLEQWGLGRKLTASAGVALLFAGPPGTGKTMGAEVIAGELGLDLYKIDLSTVISKYIGETEKNLGRVFDEAASSNAILFFDEADAIFGKRGEAKDSHDRYANIEVAYLLQRVEAYDGITILATNLRANMDEAFTRRLQFAIDFPFPDEAHRQIIWETLFPADLPRSPDLDLPFMARRFKLAGGAIRNAIVSAAYLAAADGGVVTMEHLLHGTRREMQKMGRLVGESDWVIRNPGTQR